MTEAGVVFDLAVDKAIVCEHIEHHGPIPAARSSSAQAKGAGKRYPYWGAVEYAVRLVGGRLTASPRGRAKSARRSRKLAAQDAKDLAEQLGGVVIQSIGALSDADIACIARWVRGRS